MIEIKIYKKENIEEFTSDFLDCDSKLDTGSINAAAGALCATLFKRAADSLGDGERNDYLKRNSEILRTYFIHLIDDDVKARKGYLKEIKGGNEDNIEASRHPACTINEEVISMLYQMLELIDESLLLVDKNYIHYLKESADIAIGTIRSAVNWLVDFTSYSIDDTYRYVVKRENEITLLECEKLWKKISEF